MADDIVRLLLNAGTASAWNLQDGAGNPISIAGTTTSGLTEAINFCANNGCNLDIIGGGTSRTADYGILNFSTPIIVPPLRAMSLRMLGVHLAAAPSITGDAIIWDSLQECTIDLSAGEVTYQGNGTAIVFKPRNTLPVDGTIGIDVSKIRLCAIAHVNAAATPTSCVTMDVSQGSIEGAAFEFDELNGAGAVGSSPLAQFGYCIQGANAATAFRNNTIDIGYAHNIKGACLQVGVTTNQQAAINANIYNIRRMETSGPTCDGFNSFASYDLITIAAIEGAGVHNAVRFQPGSAGNRYRLGKVVGPVIDLGSGNIAD